jgi:hypothetical protein
MAVDRPITHDDTFEIKSLQDVAIYYDLPIEATFEQIARALYDATECGAFLEVLEEKDYDDIGPGVAIGSDAQTKTHVLHYPFNGADIASAVAQVEEEASELWHAAHCHEPGCDTADCEGCQPDCGCFDDGKETPDHPGFDTAFLW